jgi:hypothetical protein
MNVTELSPELNLKLTGRLETAATQTKPAFAG